MIHSDLFTIIIPCKNEESYIYNTLKSISSQDNLDKINIIIADADSTDDTLSEILRAAYDFNNLHIDIVKGGTVSFGRNQGAKLAKTPFLLFMDADAILLDTDILLQTSELMSKYKLISAKQKTTTNKILDRLLWSFFNFIRAIIPESFSTGCYFVISKDNFVELGGFDETVTQSEDFLLSKKIPKSKFKVINRYIGQDNRRFKKMGYLNFIKLAFLNYYHRNNLDWFKKDIGYWK